MEEKEKFRAISPFSHTVFKRLVLQTPKKPGLVWERVKADSHISYPDRLSMTGMIVVPFLDTEGQFLVGRTYFPELSFEDQDNSTLLSVSLLPCLCQPRFRTT